MLDGHSNGVPCHSAFSAGRSRGPSWTCCENAEPMTVREIALALVRRGGKELNGSALALVVARVRNAMPRLGDQLDGELRGRTTFWRVKS